MQGLNLNRPAVLTGLVVIAMVVGAASAAITITDVNPNKIEAAQGTMNNSANLTVVDVSVKYSGLTANDVHLKVEDDNTNGQSGTHNFDATIQVRNSTAGTTLTSVANNGLSHSGGGNMIVKFFGLDEHVTNFDTIDMNLNETSSR